MNELVLEPFNILDHVDKLTKSEKHTKTQPYYNCPVCSGGSLMVNRQGKFKCWSGNCDSKDIMEAIRPIKQVIAQAKGKTTKWVKPPRPKATYEFFYPDRNGEKLVKVVISYSGENSKKDVKQQWWTGTTWQSFDMPEEVKAKVRLYQIDHPVNQDAIATGKPIIVGESELKVDLCLSIGQAATCNIGGSGKWETYGGAANLYVPALQGANVVLSPDRGRSGLGHCQRIAQDFPNAQWLYADPTNPKWDDLNKRYYLASNGKAPKITETTQSWLESNLPDIGEDDQLWNWLDGDEYDLRNWIEEINDPILAKQMILDAIEPQRPYEIKKVSATPALFSKPSNVVPINSKSIPPHDLNAEHFVIGQFLLDSSRVAIVLGSHVSPDHFYHPLNQQICHAIAELVRDYQPVDVMSVHAMLTRKGFGDKVGIQDLKGYRDRAEEFADNDLVFQAKVIKDKYLLRTGQTLGREVTKLFTDESKNVDDLITEMQQAVIKFTSAKTKAASFANIGEVMKNLSVNVAQAKERGEEIISNYFVTGIQELDEKFNVPLGKLIGVIASPSHGKTTWVLQANRNISLATGLPTIICSYEIDEEEVGLKHAVMETGLTMQNLRTQTFFTESDRKHFDKVADAYSESKVYVYSAKERVEKLCANLRAFAIEHGQIGCICIDYIQLVKPEKNMGTATENHDYVADMLDDLRKELNCLMIWLIQPKKDVKDVNRSDKRPKFADARGTGIYEQKVDVGLYLYRDERVNPNSPDRGMVEIGCEKNRNGEANWEIKVPFYGEKSRIGSDFTSLLDRIAASNATIPKQLKIVPQPQKAVIQEGAIVEPDIAENEFF